MGLSLWDWVKEHSPEDDRVLCKEYGFNLQDTFRLIGHTVTMTS